MHRPWLLMLAALAVPDATATLGAQITLREALRIADQAAFPNRIADANTAIQRGNALAPLGGVLPSVRLEAGYLRTTDPIGTFGVTLQQRRITVADFEPRRLNFPDAVANYRTSVVLEQPILNADAWLGRRAASAALGATAARQSWTQRITHTDVIRAYYGALLAAERVGALDAASRAAHAHVARARSLVINGMATRSDELLADVGAGDIDAQLVEARGHSASALRQLELVMGDEPTGTLSLPAMLPVSVRIRQVVAPDTVTSRPTNRADVAAARLGVDAAHAGALRARSTYLPRLNGFARYDWNAASGLYVGDRNWTVGVMASWTLFNGGSSWADVQVSDGREGVARAQADAVAAQARLEAEQSRIALAVALARLEIAERAVAQSAEAHRMVERKYGAGLATVAELLDAQAADIRSMLGLSQARYVAIVAGAARRQALGEDPAALVALEEPAPGGER